MRQYMGIRWNRINTQNIIDSGPLTTLNVSKLIVHCTIQYFIWKVFCIFIEWDDKL